MAYSDAQQRTIAAALGLFAKHGVGGTSLQMIADEVGVTKAAIYHQFKTRDAIAIAVVETELDGLQAAVDAADDSPAGRDRLLVHLVDTVVDRRHGIGTIMNDPLIEHFLNSDQRSLRMWTRMYEILLGGKLTKERRVRAAILSAAIASAGHAFVADVDNKTVRENLLSFARDYLDLA
jgi:AcrR family transcriptional regulator